MRAVSYGCSGAKRCCDVDRLGELFLGSPSCEGALLVYFDAIGALCGERHGDRHQLFVFLRDGTVRKGGSIILPEGVCRGGRQLFKLR